MLQLVLLCSMMNFAFFASSWTKPSTSQWVELASDFSKESPPQGDESEQDFGETESDSASNVVQDFLQNRFLIPDFRSDRDLFSVVRVLGFALDRPSAVHRPPWV